MTTFELVAVIVSLAGALGYLNARLLGLPSTNGLMAMALVGSLVIVGLDAGGVIDSARVQQVVASADFGHTLLHGMLGLLLFAGALHVDLADLSVHKWPIGTLALGSTQLSTAIVGVGTYLLLSLVGPHVSRVDGLLFGALISPTDPVAVLGIL
jgi:CPA1 family monovalent cation:H+ antiporter